MRGRWSTGRTSRQDADALGSTRQDSSTSASNGYSNLEVDNEDIIARYENDMNRLGLRPSSPNSSGAEPTSSKRDVRKPPVAKTTAAAAAVDSATLSKATVNSVKPIERNRRKYKSPDSKKADQFVLKNLRKSFDDMQKSFDSMLDKYHLKDTLTDKEYETTSVSSLCLGIINVFGCSDHPVFRNYIPNSMARNTNDAVTKEMIDNTIEPSTTESSIRHATLNNQRGQRDVEYKSDNATFGEQQHASFTGNSIYEQNAHEMQPSNATIRVPREQRNDDSLRLTRDGTDFLLDELRQSPV